MTKYQILCNILYKIIKDAPEKKNRYNNGKLTKEQLQALAYIHLFLLVKFGIQDFGERERYITDGPYDGGIDAYYIDDASKTIFIIQSKFRTSEKTYEEKEIEPSEIVAMDIKRILEGEKNDEEGNEYNGKINRFQEDVSKLKNRSLYNTNIIVLANVKQSKHKKVIGALLDGFEYEFFDCERAYSELVFPLCTSTYYQNDKVIIDKNIEGLTEGYTESFNNTSFGKCGVTLMFVPLLFIAEIANQYKNSILQYNPRNYLSIANNVNDAISSGVESENEDFALLNNGITMVCSKFSKTPHSGIKDTTNVHIEDPQIINGGQTAVTLSKLADMGSKVADKKVLLRVIATYHDEKMEAGTFDESAYLEFINSISDATNNQTKIDEADRRSNLKLQRNLQADLFDQYGMFYERKKGEFQEAVEKKIITKKEIIKREYMIKSILAMNGDCGAALNDNKTSLFEMERVTKLLTPIKANIAYYAYALYAKTKALETEWKAKNYNSENWGNGIRYGKWAIVMASCLQTDFDVLEHKSAEEITGEADAKVMNVLGNWKKFETQFTKKKENKSYLVEGLFGINYYKSANATRDVKEFWSSEKQS